MGVRTVQLAIGLVVVATLVGSTMVVGSTAGATDDSDGMEITVEYQVTVDGELDSVSYRLAMDDSLYEELVADTEAAGYDSYAAAVAEQWVADEAAYVSYSEATDHEVSGGYESVIEITEIDQDEFRRTTITATEESVVLNQWDVDDPETDPLIERFIMVITMPGEILETNADDVEETTATWNLHDSVPDELHVESTAGDESDSDDSLAGFDVTVALVALVAAVVGASRRRRGANRNRSSG